MIENILLALSVIVLNFASYQLGEIHGVSAEKTQISKIVSLVVTVVLSAVLYAWTWIIE